MTESIKTVIMRRDGISASEADAQIADFESEVKQIVENAEGREMAALEEIGDLCADYFGLEPDYAEDIMFKYI